nr:MAG TPA: hypothetical protein [Caudoviricetes sp.]
MLFTRQTSCRDDSMCWPQPLFVNHISRVFSFAAAFLLSFSPGSSMLAA